MLREWCDFPRIEPQAMGGRRSPESQLRHFSNVLFCRKEGPSKGCWQFSQGSMSRISQGSQSTCILKQFKKMKLSMRKHDSLLQLTGRLSGAKEADFSVWLQAQNQCVGIEIIKQQVSAQLWTELPGNNSCQPVVWVESWQNVTQFRNGLLNEHLLEIVRNFALADERLCP